MCFSQKKWSVETVLEKIFPDRRQKRQLRRQRLLISGEHVKLIWCVEWRRDSGRFTWADSISVVAARTWLVRSSRTPNTATCICHRSTRTVWSLSLDIMRHKNTEKTNVSAVQSGRSIRNLRRGRRCIPHSSYGHWAESVYFKTVKSIVNCILLIHNATSKIRNLEPLKCLCIGYNMVYNMVYSWLYESGAN